MITINLLRKIYAKEREEVDFQNGVVPVNMADYVIWVSVDFLD